MRGEGGGAMGLVFGDWGGVVVAEVGFVILKYSSVACLRNDDDVCSDEEDCLSGDEGFGGE